MWQYIIKRFLLLLLTLFLAMCFGFFISRKAPGDPLKQKMQDLARSGKFDQSSSIEIAEQNRKLYGFDKALFFSTSVDDRNSNVDELIGKLAKTNDYATDFAKRNLSELNTIAVPKLIAALDNKTSPTFVKDTGNLLSASTFDFREEPDYPSDKKSHLQWKAWWEKNQELFNEENVEAGVATFAKNPTAANRLAVLKTSSLATQYLIRTLDSGKNLPEITDLLSEIQHRPWTIKVEESNSKAQKEIVKKWKRWFRNNKAEYVVFSGAEWSWRHVTDTQFGIWFTRILRLDFGNSYKYKQPVLKLIIERLPVSLQLSIISIFLSYIIAIPLGIFSSTHQFSLSDKLLTVGLFVLYSLPSFWFADMCLLTLTGAPFWEIFPSRGLSSPGSENLPFFAMMFDRLMHLVLPITCLTYGSFAFLSRQMRVGMLETIRQDFIRTARAKGLSGRAVIYKHALRNSMIPILTLMAGLLPALLGGSIIIEQIFTIEGMGKLTFEAILNRDYPIINAVIFFSSALTLLGILISDLSYALVDPRIKFE